MKVAASLLLVALVVALGPSTAGAQDAFSCSWGKRGACLDYGDKVCSQLGKCVDEDAVCFNRSTCDYNGFVCKSDLNNLSDEYDTLLSKAKRLASDYDDMHSSYSDILQCLGRAMEIEDARRCAALYPL